MASAMGLRLSENAKNAGSDAEAFWQNLMARLGYAYEIFTEDAIRDFMHIHLHHRDAGNKA